MMRAVRLKDSKTRRTFCRELGSRNLLGSGRRGARDGGFWQRPFVEVWGVCGGCFLEVFKGFFGLFRVFCGGFERVHVLGLSGLKEG